MSREDYADFLCVDCGIDTWEIGEYYMIHKPLWLTHGADQGMLCIGCLEDRIGRRLTSADFTDYPINRDTTEYRSPRLRTRLRGADRLIRL